MKKILITLGLATAAIVGSAKVVTTKVDDSILSLVKGIDNLGPYSAELVDYQQGLISNSGKVRLRYQDPLASLNSNSELPEWAKEFELEVNFEIQNGLLLSGGLNASEFTIEIPAQELRQYVSWPKGQSLVSVEGQVALNGNVSYQDTIAAITFDEAHGLKGFYKGYQGQAVTKGDTLSHSANWGELQLDTEEGVSITMSAMSSELVMPANIYQILSQGSWYDSVMTVNVGELNTTFTENGEQKSLAIKDFGIEAESTTSEDKQTGDVDIVYSVANVQLDDWKGSDFKLAVSANKLDVQFFEQFNALSNDLNQLPQEQHAPAILGFFEENLLTLMLHEPELNFTEVAATIPEGTLSASSNSKLVGINTLPVALNDAQFWLGHLASDSALEMDKAVLELLAQKIIYGQLAGNPQLQNMSPEQLQQIVAQQSNQTIQMGLQQGFIIEKDNKYLSNISLKDKIVKVNEVSFPLPIN